MLRPTGSMTVTCRPGWWQCEYQRCKRRAGPVEKDGIVCGLLKAKEPRKPANEGVMGRVETGRGV